MDETTLLINMPNTKLNIKSKQVKIKTHEKRIHTSVNL